ncbi:FAD-binding oxidoreductase [Allopontixanthobacter sediminis]|uniref:FAD-binding protein n=1 Tax=Allopontixanthobacter sediminis TaxID=1689985 RepID=A0A845AWH4_9SPHN|nr:FAD-binding oxidoreductase [Allopontixanthobacter sediminis]MXP43361.1 FAD-binding protein [Allopontixanthobacter sediminis]
MTDQDDFCSAAENLLGPRGFTTDPDLVLPWLTDWRGRYHGAALALASPANTDEVSRLMKLCGKHGIAVVPQGGNSGMSGGATPDASGNAVVLSLRRMNRIVELDPIGRKVTCEAGVVLQALHEAAAAEELRFPLTLGGKGSATIGGLISTNAGGTQVLRHGTMRAQVLGLEAVMADGAILDTLVPLKKDNRGFDLKQMLIGSEGTLGIVTGATLRLLPASGGRVVAWVGLGSLTAARELLLRCEAQSPDTLEGFEVLPRHCLTAVLDHLSNARSPLEQEHEWNVLIEWVSAPGAQEAVREQAEEILTSALDDGLVGDAALAENETQAEAMWLLRDSISVAERALGPAMQHDISVPVAKMADFVEQTVPEVETAFPGTRALAFGHLGDGNVHFHVLAPTGAIAGQWEDTDGKTVSRFVHDRVTEVGGSISAEHGIGQMKRDELARLGDPVALALMRSVKLALDPANLLNPGKLVPDVDPMPRKPV